MVVLALELAPGYRQFAFDQIKRLKVLQDHGIDLVAAVPALSGDGHLRYASPRGEELRHVALVEIQGALLAVAYVDRDGICRLITARATRVAERRAYRAIHDRRDPGETGLG